MESATRSLLRAKQSTPCLKTDSVKKERRVIIIDNSLLGGTEGLICWPYPTERSLLPFCGMSQGNYQKASYSGSPLLLLPRETLGLSKGTSGN